MKRATRTSFVITVLLILATVAAGCSGQRPAQTGDAPAEAVEPAAVRLDTPENAVRSYLEWISYAYRVGDSEVATPTLTPNEEVRVNSYVQYNLEQGRAISQRLVSLDTRVGTQTETTATVSAQERWTYRYISLKTSKYSSPEYEASYDSTYTVVRGEDGLWRVDAVEATSRGEVK